MKPFLSVVISALNEEKTVQAVLTNVLKVFDKHKINAELIFLNNHSTDNTGKFADVVAKKDKRLRVIHRYNRENKDLGSSLREGLSNVKGQYFTIMDCDLSHDPEEIPNLLKHIHEADIVIGSRFVKGGKSDMPLKRQIISRSYNLFARIFLRTNIKDLTTGFKLYRADILNNITLESTGFGLHVELLAKALLKGYKAKEIPIYYKRSDKKSTLSYRRQFKSYVLPVLKAFWWKLSH